MPAILQIRESNNYGLVDELTEMIANIDSGIEDVTPRGRNISSTEIIVALGTAGAFTGLYQLLISLLTKDLSRELTIERDGIKISLKGQSMPEMEMLIEKFAPELLNETRTKESQK